MAISAFDLFKIGIGPSSSHTVGPMKAARMFVQELDDNSMLSSTSKLKAEMFGSLGATGRGHGTPKAVLMGLEGERPESVDVGEISARVARIREQQQLHLASKRVIDFDPQDDLVLHRRKMLPFHPNGMVFAAFNRSGEQLLSKTYFSVGGGFVVDESDDGVVALVENETVLTHPFDTAAELIEHCQRSNQRVSDIMFDNEKSWRTESEVREGLSAIWTAMQQCIENGIANDGILPGGLNVPRRAKNLYNDLLRRPEASVSDPLISMDWVTLYALAVNEENAAGGRVVTAPTNGAAGIIPAVLQYHMRSAPNALDEDPVRFLLVAAAIGMLFKKNASISGAEVGCQGEVGVACSMAAGALTEVLGGTPEQVENAAEIGMEHNLGLTCDPIGGLVQIPCIERNAMGAMKAIHAARIALRGDGSHFVSLDKVIKTMRKTGQDMHTKYKETSRGGLAVHVVEVPVNITEC